MLDHTELFCTLDDFCNVFEPFYRQSLKDADITKRTRRSWKCMLAHVYGVMVAYQLCKAKSKIRPFDGVAYP